MRRCLFAILSVLSLVICVATAGLWVRSYFAEEAIGRVHYTPGIPDEASELWLHAHRGVIELHKGGYEPEGFSMVRWEWRQDRFGHGDTFRRLDEPPFLHAIGISWMRPRLLLTGERYWRLRARLALPASLSAFATVVCLVAWRRYRRRTMNGMCLRCGYDLRATLDRCPECGTPVPDGHVMKVRP